MNKLTAVVKITDFLKSFCNIMCVVYKGVSGWEGVGGQEGGGRVVMGRWVGSANLRPRQPSHLVRS